MGFFGTFSRPYVVLSNVWTYSEKISLLRIFNPIQWSWTDRHFIVHKLIYTMNQHAEHNLLPDLYQRVQSKQSIHFVVKRYVTACTYQRLVSVLIYTSDQHFLCRSSFNISLSCTICANVISFVI